MKVPRIVPYRRIKVSQRLASEFTLLVVQTCISDEKWNFRVEFWIEQTLKLVKLLKTLEWHRHEIIFEASALGSGAVELLRSFNYKSCWNVFTRVSWWCIKVNCAQRNCLLPRIHHILLFTHNELNNRLIIPRMFPNLNEIPLILGWLS